MKNREKRLRAIGSVAIPPKWSPNYQRVIDFLKARETPETKAYVKKSYEIATATLDSTLWNGSGLPMSEMLRYYLMEYNYRAFSHGLYSMPTSFSFAECFFEYEPPLNYFKLKTEQEYLFSFFHFLDWITSNSGENPFEFLMNYMEEEIIYSFNVSQDPKVMEFNLSSGNSLCVVGVSLLRSGSEVVVLLVGGESGKCGEEIHNYENFTPYPGKENMSPDPSLRRERVMLEGVSDHQRIVAMTRFDLSDKTSLFRYYAEDMGDSFLGYTDDLETIMLPDGSMDEHRKKAAQAMQKHLNDRQSVFELCKTFMTLPVFAADNIEATKLQRFDTELKTKQKSLKDRKRIERALDCSKIYFREVREITNQVDLASYSNVTINSTSFEQNDDGYWKRLLPWEIGTGKDGLSQTKGRTWVKLQSITTNDQQATPTESQVSGHLASCSPIPKGPNYGFVYVMRNAQYERDIYKIGLTQRTPDARAKDLSRTSGVIDHFAVMNDWEVSDCVLAEKQIHSKLQHARLTDRREFFKAPYKEIFSIIHEVVEKINREAQSLQ